MKRKPRIYYSDSQKALMWERWRQGDPLQAAYECLTRCHSKIVTPHRPTSFRCTACLSSARLRHSTSV